MDRGSRRSDCEVDFDAPRAQLACTADCSHPGAEGSGGKVGGGSETGRGDAGLRDDTSLGNVDAVYGQLITDSSIESAPGKRWSSVRCR